MKYLINLKMILLFIVISSFNYKIQAQTEICGTPELTEEEKEIMFEEIQQAILLKAVGDFRNVPIPVAVHILLDDNGNGNVPD